GQPLPHASEVSHVALGPGGTTLLTASSVNKESSSDGSARVWEVARGPALAPRPPFETSVLDGERSWFSDDGRTALTAPRAEGGENEESAVLPQADLARLWDVLRGRPIGDPLPLGGTLMFAAFSSNGGRLLTVSDISKSAPDRLPMVQLWDVASGRPIGPS